MQERTGDGYVFRFDLRLRPDPSSTPPVVAAPMALAYYESVGQNWERAAMIKARPAAGDLPLGQEFIDRLKPYVWRKYLDFAAIEDIHSIKRQIDATHGHGHIAVEGHDVKLGRGGIREVEFYAQTHQLIHGGRHPAIRLRGTRASLDALAEAGLIALVFVAAGLTSSQTWAACGASCANTGPGVVTTNATSAASASPACPIDCINTSPATTFTTSVQKETRTGVRVSFIA